MKLWLSKNSEIPLRDQLTRQIMLAIASGDLKVGDKLPSVRELAHRFKIHQNTVSHAYHYLEENGWVEARKGSGVFVRELTTDRHETVKAESENQLGKITEEFIRTIKQMGFSEDALKACIEREFSKPRPESLTLIESNKHLADILSFELLRSLNTPINIIHPKDISPGIFIESSIFIAMHDTAEMLRSNLQDGANLNPIKLTSALMEMKGETRPGPDDLIGIVSGWEMFRRWAKTFLLAVGINPETLLVRDPAEDGYEKGLSSCIYVISDSLAATKLSPKLNVRVFRLISDEFLEEMKTLID